MKSIIVITYIIKENIGARSVSNDARLLQRTQVRNNE